MSHILSATNSGLLSYGITTQPDPIQASPTSGNPSLTSLVITVSNNTTNEIYCNQMTFSFPIGTLAQDLASTGDGILVSSNPSDKWKIGETSPGVFTATPISPDDSLITIDGISFQIFNIQANTEVGSFTLSIVENSSTDNKTYQDRTNSFELAKFPYGFYVNHFAASSPQVQDKSPVTLTWTGSDLAEYKIQYGTTIVDVTNVRSWTSPDLTDTTTFALKASVQEQGETVDTFLYVTVIVNDPDIQCSTLTATGLVQGVGLVPPDSILMQSGDITNKYDSTGAGIAGTPYEGWAICNGANSTIDLRDRFLVGAGNNYNINDSGGADSITLDVSHIPSHNHGVTDPGHTHDATWPMRATTTDIDDDSLDIYARNNPAKESDWVTTSNLTGISINNTGGGQSFDNRPSYYALYYIMRIQP